MKYRYRAFGLSFVSEIELPGWPTGSGAHDVKIVRGNVPECLSNSRELWGGIFQGTPQSCILNYSVGRLLIADGCRIVIEPKGDERSLAYVIGSTGVTALCHQRDQLCLHASAVVWQGKAHLFMGPSGAGKSTLASALRQLGGMFLSDDISVVNARKDACFEALPGLPATRLKQDFHCRFGDASSATEPELVDGKYVMRFQQSVASEPAPIARICFVETDPRIAAPVVSPILGHERVSALQRSFFRRSMGRVLGNSRSRILTSISLAQAIDVVRLTRPENGSPHEALQVLGII